MVQSWSETGGTLIIGYEMFRLMVTKKSSQTSSTSTSTKNINISSPLTTDLEEEDKNFETMEGRKKRRLIIWLKIKFSNIDIRNALINPDLVICDEGHRIKNHQAGVAIALKSIKTQ
jgi:RAD54-like protein 2